MRCLKLVIEYDGTEFVGWQSQLNGRAVQDVLLRALQQIIGEKVTLIGAGRTDSGVHARGQVASFRTEKSIPSTKLHQALNGLLPQDVRIHDVDEVPASFHPRFDARQRRYSYSISTRPTALDRRTSWCVKYSFDTELISKSAEIILGKHDFSAFCKHEAEIENRICTVVRSHWTVSNGRMVYEIAADRFIHGMVRALVGTMVNIGRGHTPIEDFGEILASCSRAEAGSAAPARGLCLEEVLY
jgi:tRNA pseudouridine38-40 synthase